AAMTQYPIGSLKIDQSVERGSYVDRNDATIVRTIIEMGRSLGMDVVAEGVETEGQLQFLREAGCNFAQGRLFGDPSGAEILGALLSRQVVTGRSPFPCFTDDAPAVRDGSA